MLLEKVWNMAKYIPLSLMVAYLRKGREGRSDVTQDEKKVYDEEKGAAGGVKNRIS